MNESHQRLKQLFLLSRDAILGVEDGTVVFANATADRFWGKSVEKAQVSDLFPSHISLETADHSICSTRINQQPVSVSIVRWESLTLICVTPLSGDEHVIIDFLPVVASLNSSMHNLRAAAEWLLDTVDLSSERANFTAAIMTRSYFVILRTLHNISTLQQLADGTIAFDPVWSDLSVFLGDLLHSVEALVSRMGMNVVFRQSGKDFSACIDEKLMEQLVLNLLSNCLLHMEKGNTVTVTLTSESERILLSVDDNGSGMDEETIGGLFKSAVRETPLSAFTSGAGLGLYIVRGIVDRHGGTILVESRAGEGTSIRIMLPKGEPTSPRFSSAQSVYQNRNMDSILRELSGVLGHAFYQRNYLD